MISFKALRGSWSPSQFIFQNHGMRFLTLTCQEMTNVYELPKLLVLLDIPKGKIPSESIEKKSSYLERILYFPSWQNGGVSHSFPLSEGAVQDLGPKRAGLYITTDERTTSRLWGRLSVKCHVYNGMIRRTKKIQSGKVEEDPDDKDERFEGMSCGRKASLVRFLQDAGWGSRADSTKPQSSAQQKKELSTCDMTISLLGM